MGKARRDLVAAELHAAGDELLHQRRGAAEGHVLHADAGLALQHLTHQVHEAAGTSGAVEERR